MVTVAKNISGAPRNKLGLLHDPGEIIGCLPLFAHPEAKQIELQAELCFVGGKVERLNLIVH